MQPSCSDRPVRLAPTVFKFHVDHPRIAPQDTLSSAIPLDVLVPPAVINFIIGTSCWSLDCFETDPPESSLPEASQNLSGTSPLG